MQKEINKFENERNEIERCLYFLNGNDNLSNEEVAFLEMHITQKKRELVNKTFKQQNQARLLKANWNKYICHDRRRIIRKTL